MCAVVRNRLTWITSFSRRVSTLLLLLVLGATARAQSPFPELGGMAKLLSFSGQVSVVRNDSLWALHVGDLVQPQQVIRTGSDGYAVFQVSDGSKFEVFANAKVVFRANRGDWKDLLEIMLGKVRVQIEHWGGLPNHNKIRTPSAVISVRGTIFDVEVEDEDATTLVLVEDGKVDVARAFRLDDVKTLSAGEWLRVYRNAPIGLKFIDKGSVMRRAVEMARDAAIQMIQNGRSSTGTGSGTTSSPGDKNNSPPPPTAPPPAPTTTPPAPPHP